MPLSIKDPEADHLARSLAQRTGETITQAVVKALRERLVREQHKAQNAADVERLVVEIMALGRHFAALPIRDQRSLEEMLYNEHGLPA
jgi:antitoxin VapB